MEQAQCKKRILILLAFVILMSSSYISVNGSGFQKVNQDIFTASITLDDKLLSGGNQRFSQLIMEDGIRTLSSFTCAIRSIFRNNNGDSISFYSMFADFIKLAAVIAFLTAVYICQKEWESFSSQKRVLKFIHNTDGKKKDFYFYHQKK